jgi:DNA-binding NarL/FixJ family response regulator
MMVAAELGGTLPAGPTQTGGRVEARLPLEPPPARPPSAKPSCTAPDVVLMDLQMPDLNGIEATRELRRVVPSAAVLVLTMFDDDSVFSAMRAGARGSVLKGAEQQEIARAIAGVAAGEAIFGPAVATRVLAYFATPPRSPTPFPELTTREREVLDLIAAGRNNHQIAEALTLSGKTVANHISAIFAKLQVADRTQAILRARDAGMGHS